MAVKSTFHLLADIISQAVDTIEDVYATAGLDVPSLDESFNPASPAEALRRHPLVSAATLDLVVAAGQIAAIAQDPVISALNNAYATGDKGMAATDIAAHSQADPLLLARILRLLATHHVFHKGKPTKTLLEAPKDVEVLSYSMQSDLD
ncbi:hypothetical protein B0H17DRAFT_1216570 [Mycena rosella]|uniref:Uncharacterized protein n=1 Tax=Mycena rosella TaxID=1033263 RepID=A0AAD7FSA8_MYCRO|nr:hypothetical protein B0H17DRAFT_1216570 [Mycena rosella]